jgi:hypothetical protein
MEKAMTTSRAVHTAGIFGFVVVSLLAMSASIACTIRATDQRWLNRESDIIAVGVIHIDREKIEYAGQPHELVSGVARLEVKRYLRYRDLRTKWIEFSYWSQFDPDCGLTFGIRPEAGQKVKVWFGRDGNKLQVLQLDTLDEPEEDDAE